MPTLTREQWLAKATTALRPHFQKAGYEIPKNVKSTCGFPSKDATSRKKRRIGECWDARASDGQQFEIFISPLVHDTWEVLAILAHELAHATVGLEAGHGATFARCARAIGLEGKMTATVAGPKFTEWCATGAGKKLGEYPHKRLNASSAPKIQPTRLLKVECPCCREDGDNYIVRMSATTFAKGAPICPIHNEAMELAQ